MKNISGFVVVNILFRKSVSDFGLTSLWTVFKLTATPATPSHPTPPTPACYGTGFRTTIGYWHPYMCSSVQLFATP